MAARQTVAAQCGRMQPRRTAREPPCRAIDRPVDQLVGLLLLPLDRAERAGHAQAQVVLHAGVDLRRHQHATGAVGEAQQQVGIVVEGSARHQRAEVGAQALDLQAGDRGDQVLRVRADVADGARRPTARGVQTPAGLLVAAVLERGGEPALAVLAHHLAQRAQFAGRHHGTRLPHHRIATVVVGDAEHRALPRDGGDERVGLRTGVHQRLVAHDVETGLDEGLRHREMHMVGRHDDDEIDALVGRAPQFVGQQRGPVAVVACLVQEQVAARRTGLVRARRKRAGDQLGLAVERDRVAVHRADEGVAPTPDHGVAQLAQGRRTSGRRRHRAHRFSLANTASKAPAAGLKSSRLQKAALSVAPCTRSIRLSSHSTLKGPA